MDKTRETVSRQLFQHGATIQDRRITHPEEFESLDAFLQYARIHEQAEELGIVDPLPAFCELWKGSK